MKKEFNKFYEYMFNLNGSDVLGGYIYRKHNFILNNTIYKEKINSFLITKLINENENILTINGIMSNGNKSKFKLINLNKIYYEQRYYGFDIYFMFNNNDIDMFIYNLFPEELDSILS